MPRLVALKEHKYDSILRKPGGPSYEATEKHAFILKRLGRAADAPSATAGSVPAPAPTYVPKPAPARVEATVAPEDEASDIPPAIRRRYQRRDLKAQE